MTIASIETFTNEFICMVRVRDADGAEGCEQTYVLTAA